MQLTRVDRPNCRGFYVLFRALDVLRHRLPRGNGGVLLVAIAGSF